MTENTLSTWAYSYAWRGLPVIPLQPRGKAPVVKKWTDLKPTPVDARSWWASRPESNIGLMCGTRSGIVDVETDLHDGLNGEDSLSAWANETGCDLGKPWRFRSGGGGIHRLYRCGETVRNRTGVLPAVDVRGDGGQCVLPPSLHPNGNRYEWLPGEGPEDDPEGPGVIPIDLLTLIKGDNRKAPLEVPEEIEDHTRNNTLFKLGSKLRGSGLHEDEIAAALHAINLSRCNPPMDDEEVERIAHSTSRYERGTTEEPTTPALVSAADVPYTPPRWVMEPFLQIGKGTLIQGDPGVGKTAVVCSLASHISTGAPLLGRPVQKPGPVLILSVEDDLPVLRGRIEANGGDLTRCHFMTNAAEVSFSSAAVEDAIKQVGAVAVIFDPLQAFLGASVDMHRSNETRPVLARLFEMCDRCNCSCILVAHLGKAGKDKTAVTRSLGSVDIPAAMRSVLHVCRSPMNEERLILHVKSSNAPRSETMAYTIGDRGAVTWQGFRDFTEDDLDAQRKRAETGLAYEAEPLVLVFRELMVRKPAGGFWSYADIHTIGAELLGFPPFDQSRDLLSRLTPQLRRELQQKDHIIVTTGARATGGVRGIRLTPEVIRS